MISGKVNMSWNASEKGAGWMAYDQLTNGLDSSGREINWLSPDRFQANTLQTALDDPGGLLRRVIAGTRSLKDQFFERTNFWWGLTPLVIVALFKHPWDRRRLRHEAFLITVILGLLFVFLPFGVLMRYFAPAFPVLLIWTARGALDMGVWLQDTLALWRGKSASETPLKVMLRWLPAGMVVGFLILTIPVTAQGWIGVTAFGDKEAGLWLKEHTPADAKIMTQELGVTLYAERRYVPSPHTDWTRFMKYARAHNADYLVVRDYRLAEYRPQLAFLLERGAPELELVFTFEEPLIYGTVKTKTFVYHISAPRSSD
jgi:hypothetical protein